MVPYEITGGPQDYVKVKVGDKEYTPPEISALVLRKLKESAEGVSGAQSQQGSHYGSCLLQRFTATGD